MKLKRNIYFSIILMILLFVDVFLIYFKDNYVWFSSIGYLILSILTVITSYIFWEKNKRKILKKQEG